MPTGLVRRGARYYLRRRIPTDLVESYGRVEIVKALGTSDFAEAKKRLALEWVRLDKEFEERLRTSSLSDRQLAPSVAQPTEPEVRRKGFPGVFAAMRATLDASFPETFAPQASPNPGRAMVRPTPPKSAKKVTWEQVADRWARERKPQPKTRKAHEAVARAFVARRGNVPVCDTTKADVLAFKDYLVDSGVSPGNLTTKLSRFKTLVNYAYENDLIATKVTEGIRGPKSKRRARVPFDDMALAALFNGPVHKEGARPIQGRGEASYWLPLIAMFTGARLEEIAGLLVIDLMELRYQDENGNDQAAWFFRFSPDANRNRDLKNDESERVVPVYPELIRLGLIRYAKAIEADGATQLFPRLTAHRSGKRAHKWGQWFGTYLRQTCGVSDERMDFHSFRHFLKDAARESGVSEELQRAIMGHAQKDVAGGYGLGFNRRKIVEGMNSIRIPGMPTLQTQM